MKIVEITYKDITQIEDKTTKQLMKVKPKILKAVGFLLLEDNEHYKIIYNFDTDEKDIAHDALIIPKGCVIGVREVE